MKRILIYFLILFVLLAGSAEATTVIYDNLSTSQYKILKIDDATNFKYINDYPYVVYVDGALLGKFGKDDEIQIPDNSNVTIFIPSPIKTDLATSWDLGKSLFGVGFFVFLSVGLLIIAAWMIYRKFKRWG